MAPETSAEAAGVLSWAMDILTGDTVGASSLQALLGGPDRIYKGRNRPPERELPPFFVVVGVRSSTDSYFVGMRRSLIKVRLRVIVNGLPRDPMTGQATGDPYPVALIAKRIGQLLHGRTDELDPNYGLAKIVDCVRAGGYPTDEEADDGSVWQQEIIDFEIEAQTPPAA